MNRSLNLLRPVGARGIASASSKIRPTVLARSPVSVSGSASRLSPRLAQSLGLSLRSYASSAGKTGQEGVKSGSSGSAEVPKENPHADQQNATSSAAEEVKGAARDFASMIGGGGQYQSLGMETSSHGHGGSIAEDFYSVTKGMVSDVPKSALFFGGAGLVPYIGTAAATVGLAREAAIAADGTDQAALDNALSLLHTMEHIQITYGVAILSFLGAIHWGFEFSKVGGEQGWRRLAIGVVPVLFAWPTTFLTHGVALAAQWAGFTGLWFLDQKATSKGWTTSWYSTYRFYLSIVVGFSIIATLAGTSYYGAGAGAVNQIRVNKTQHTTIRQSPVARLDRVKEKNKPESSGKLEGTVAGDMQVDEREDGEGYLKLRNIAHEEEEEEEKKQEAEEKKKEAQRAKAEKQDKKDEGQMDKAPGDMKNTAQDRTGKNKNVEGGEEKEAGDKTAGMEDAVEKHNQEKK